MKTIPIPKTDLHVSPVCFGQGGIGVNNTDNEAKRLLDIFADSGGNFIDSARIYSDWVPGEIGRSERIIGDYFRESGKRDKFVVCTKGGHQYPAKNNGLPQLELDKLQADMENSLKALRTDYIDLYVLHRDSAPEISVESIFNILKRAQKEGKIRWFGVSNWRPGRLNEMLEISGKNGGGMVVNQIGFSLGSKYCGAFSDPTIVLMDDETEKIHRKHNLFTMGFSSLSNGWFQRNLNKKTAYFDSLPWGTPQNKKILQNLKKLSAESHIPALELELGFLMTQDFPTVPIFSASKEKHLREILPVLERDFSSTRGQLSALQNID